VKVPVCALPAAVFIVIHPVVAPFGTLNEMVLGVILRLLAIAVPLRSTAALSKLDPLMTTCVPTGPESGVKAVMMGG